MTILFCYFFDAKITEALSQNLITFFSIVFGFYMTSIAIIFNSSYAKHLYSKINDKGDKREIHILKDYFLVSGYWSLLSINLILLFMIFGEKSNDVLTLALQNFSLFGRTIESNLLINAFIFGISAVNIFFMTLIFNTILSGMVQESRNG